MSIEKIKETARAFLDYLDSITAVGGNPLWARNIRTTIWNRNTFGASEIEEFNDIQLNKYAWYPWYNSLKSEDIYKRLGELNVPKLNVWEFQPSTTLGMYLRLLREAVDTFSSQAGRVASASEAFDEIVQTLGTEISLAAGIINPTDPQTIARNFQRGNNFFSNLLLDGRIFNRFEFPCYNDEIWQSTGGGWEGGSVLQRYLGIFSGILSPLGVDAPAKPYFDKSKMQTPSIESKFYLFNGHIAAAISNLKLLYTLLPGAYWIQDSYYQRGSNLYTVRYENYHQLQMCTMDVTIKMIGKCRRSPARVLEAYKSVTMLPDIYEVSLKFTSLFPQSLNEFLAPYNFLMDPPHDKTIYDSPGPGQLVPDFGLGPGELPA
jgi:hypothetical protein